MKKIDKYVKKVEKEQPKWVSIVRKRRYKMPMWYMPWEKISAIVAMHLVCHEAAEEFYPKQDSATQIVCIKLSQWFLQDAPIYCISSELLKAFEKADLSNVYELFKGFKTGLPTCLIVLPEGSLITSEGHEIPFLLIHIADKSKPKLSEASGHGLTIPYLPHDGDKNIHISTIDSGGSTWVSGLTADDSGKLFDSGKNIGAQELSLDDLSDSSKIKKIGLQCLLALAYAPELLGEDSEPEPLSSTLSNRKIAQARPNGSKVRRPRWIRSPKPKSPRKPHQGGTHASPDPHWRKPHEKRVVIGPRKLGGRKVVQIGATWVNPE